MAWNLVEAKNKLSEALNLERGGFEQSGAASRFSG